MIVGDWFGHFGWSQQSQSLLPFGIDAVSTDKILPDQGANYYSKSSSSRRSQFLPNANLLGPLIHFVGSPTHFAIHDSKCLHLASNRSYKHEVLISLLAASTQLQPSAPSSPSLAPPVASSHLCFAARALGASSAVFGGCALRLAGGSAPELPAPEAPSSDGLRSLKVIGTVIGMYIHPSCKKLM